MIPTGKMAFAASIAAQGMNYVQSPEGQAAMWNFATRVGTLAGQGAVGSVKFVGSIMALGWLSNLTYYFTPNFRLPGFTTGTNNIGETNWGEVHFPKLDVEEFAKGVVEIGQAIGDSGWAATVTIGAAALCIYLAYSVNHFILHYVKELASHTMGRPTLSRKYQFSDWQAKLYNAGSAPIAALSKLIFRGEEQIEPKKPIFKLEIQEQLDDIIASLENVQANKGTYENVILYGPPGTGKSMTAQYIAENCGMNFMEISGGDLAKFIGSKNPPVEELNKVFGRMKASSKPTVLFIDEFDGFATQRSKLDISRIEILNAFLNLTGTPSSKVIILAATNRAHDLDSAVNSRFGDKIYMGPPAAPERLAILKMYVDEFFESDEDQAVFSADYLDRLNERLGGQTGRTIYKLMNKCYMKKAQQEGGVITEALIDKTITRFFENEREAEIHVA